MMSADSSSKIIRLIYKKKKKKIHQESLFYYYLYIINSNHRLCMEYINFFSVFFIFILLIIDVFAFLYKLMICLIKFKSSENY